jgi:hypothetical protein
VNASECPFALADPCAKLLFTAEFFGSGFSRESRITAFLSLSHKPSFASPAIRETSSCLYLSLPLAILPAARPCVSVAQRHDKKKQGHSHHARPGDHLACQGNRQNCLILSFATAVALAIGNAQRQPRQEPRRPPSFTVPADSLEYLIPTSRETHTPQSKANSPHRVLSKSAVTHLQPVRSVSSPQASSPLNSRRNCVIIK